MFDTPVRRDIAFVAGATLRLVFGIAVDGVRWNMTGWQSNACIRLTDARGVPLTGTPVLQSTSSYDATAQEWTLNFVASDSAALVPSLALLPGVNYVWDWKLTSTANVVYVPLAGDVTVLRKVS